MADRTKAQANIYASHARDGLFHAYERLSEAVQGVCAAVALDMVTDTYGECAQALRRLLDGCEHGDPEPWKCWDCNPELREGRKEKIMRHVRDVEDEGNDEVSVDWSDGSVEVVAGNVIHNDGRQEGNE